MQRSEAPIQSPCSEDWNAMEGNDQRRFCGQCAKHVHNLSAMTEGEARAVVADRDVCVRYSVDPRTRTIRHRPSRRFFVRVAATAGLTAGLALPAAAALSREPGEVGLLAQVWETLTGWGDAADVTVVQGGLEMVEWDPPTEPSQPPGVVDGELEMPLMGDIALPEEVVEELGELEPAVE